MTALHLFEAFGVELEYMIVDATTLDVRPIADRLLVDLHGSPVSEVEQGEAAWSNELVLHVIELKTNGPAASLEGLDRLFQQQVEQINARLARHGARLMPTAMHPWMDPDQEMQLWPRDYNPVYQAFDRIFDCRGHGWANLQSAHLNLPFADDEEFGRLHAAIRLLLPLLPALAASSPFVAGQFSGRLDHRLEVYRHNARRVPSVTGTVIPEPVFTRRDYEQRILEPMYRDIAPYDPQGILQQEWLNARGAIARFDRDTIEIRVLDVQECPAADVAICQAVVAILRALVNEHWTAWEDQQEVGIEPLADVLQGTLRDAEAAIIAEPTLLRQFGYPQPRVTAGELWHWMLEQVDAQALHSPAMRLILDRGPLARRIVNSLAGGQHTLRTLYGQLCDCLAEGCPFDGA
ncbi:MAG: glutamate--cysteine ligase [Pirellulaceae bacterium]|nr:MAG: glutamate--cysteine ligase [Pirellulaceae bacterium]